MCAGTFKWVTRSADLARRVVGRARRAAAGVRHGGVLFRVSRRRFVDVAYQSILGREPDVEGQDRMLAELASGRTRRDLLDELIASREFGMRPAPNELVALHTGRKDFVRSLPEARRILDLGGTDLSDSGGAFLSLGYPYTFDDLVIVDLPRAQRHESYASEEVLEVINTELGPVRYRYHSMADLTGIAGGSVDLVYSGQTFEHVTVDDGHRVLNEAKRVLTSGGVLCLDTPNRSVTRVQLEGTDNEFIDPDHEIEYTVSDLRKLFAEHGFVEERCHGIGWVPGSVDSGVWDRSELCRSKGLYSDVERCYLMAFVLRCSP